MRVASLMREFGYFFVVIIIIVGLNNDVLQKTVDTVLGLFQFEQDIQKPAFSSLVSRSRSWLTVCCRLSLRCLQT
jgi:hypothetical protein